jgi:general secretion pathway protein G
VKLGTLIACFLVMPILALCSYISYEDQLARKAKVQMRASEERVVQQAIREYTVHEGKPPQSLNDLVTAGYLRAIPGYPPKLDIPAAPPALGHPQSISVPSI